MGKTKDIKDDLKSLLEGLQYSGGNAFGAVLDYPESQFDHWPSAILLPRNTDNEIFDQATNERREGYDIFVFWPIENDDVKRNFEAQFAKFYDYKDLILNLMDSNQYLGQTVVLMQPTVVDWSVQETKAGMQLVVQFSLVVRYNANVS